MTFQIVKHSFNSGYAILDSSESLEEIILKMSKLVDDLDFPHFRVTEENEPIFLNDVGDSLKIKEI